MELTPACRLENSSKSRSLVVVVGCLAPLICPVRRGFLKGANFVLQEESGRTPNSAQLNRKPSGQTGCPLLAVVSEL